MRTGVYLAICLGYIAVSCAAVSIASPNQRSNPAITSDFSNKIIEIDRLAGPTVALEGLLSDEPFNILADQGAEHIDECILFLADGHTAQQRAIALLSMHKLGVHEYVSFLKKLLDLFDKGLISPAELGSAVVPGYAFSTVLIQNYSDRDEQSVLKEILARSGIRTATRSAIESIISGDALEKLMSFRRDCCSGHGKQH